MKIIFFGTSEFGVPSLSKIISDGHNILHIVTAPPKPANRGKKLFKSPIHQVAEESEINIITPSKLTEECFDGIEFDLGVVISYGMIIPEFLLSRATHGFINLHPSSLPRWRGAAPIERAIEAGDAVTSVCVIRMTPKLDDGDIIAKLDVKISESDTAAILHSKFSELGAGLIAQTIRDIAIDANLVVTPQSDVGITYASKIKKEETYIDLNSNGFLQDVIINKIRAFDSHGYCYTMYDNKRIKIISAQKSDTKSTILDIACSNGFVSPVEIIPEGRGRMGVASFINGLNLK